MKFIIRHFRELVYALLLGLGAVMLRQLALSSLNNFYVGISFIGILLLLALYLNYLLATKKLKQFDLPISNNIDPSSRFVMHIIQPLIFLVSISAFIFTNRVLDIDVIFFIITSLVYFGFLLNIRAYYEDRFKLEESSRFIYDIAKIFSFFFLTTATISFANSMGFNFYVVTGLVFVISSLLTLLLIVNKNSVDYINILLIMIAGLSVGYFTASVNFFLDGTNLVIGFFATVIFYTLNGVIHHELDRSLKLSILIEYVFVAVISLLVVLLLS